ncbi:OsmC family protein [Candidatus Venteria ishoeyi]|uniref:OsmC-like protein n=1 Tax=Candidatus Venteria ishoeyi TaxID=1899563 RepID=A0A1H6F7E3_9GAMM|nr:OsmC family protein [Candidatus Venteria ishoeyi]MDM8545819.1 OsmC family protein [Candidatus Venteria ishoeyi]SEH04974.1 Uncharacterised protein [Candidatus Venteria ishoeyi]
MTNTAKIKWIEGATLMAESGSGHAIVLDGPPEVGGQDLGTRPMELILMGLGGCTALDIRHILEKSRQVMTGLEIQVSGDRAEADPKVYTKIHMHFVVGGEDLKPKQVERAIELSAEKYCSVAQMLCKTAEITHSFEIQ